MSTLKHLIAQSFLQATIGSVFAVGLFLTLVNQPGPGAAISGDWTMGREEVNLWGEVKQLPAEYSRTDYLLTSADIVMAEIALDAESRASAKEMVESCFGWQNADCLKDVIFVEYEFGSLEDVGFSKVEANNIRDLTARWFTKALHDGRVQPIVSKEESVDHDEFRDLPSTHPVAFEGEALPTSKYVCRAVFGAYKSCSERNPY
jgi:hypothetical protein